MIPGRARHAHGMNGGDKPLPWAMFPGLILLTAAGRHGRTAVPWLAGTAVGAEVWPHAVSPATAAPAAARARRFI